MHRRHSLESDCLAIRPARKRKNVRRKIDDDKATDTSSCVVEVEEELDQKSDHQLEDPADNVQDRDLAKNLPKYSVRLLALLALIKSEADKKGSDDEGPVDDVVDERATGTAATTGASSAASIPAHFTAKEMAGLAEILSLCSLPRSAGRSSNHAWVKARWANWSLVDPVFYLATSQYE